ncbi:MAG: IS110 family transposase [Gaiellaceae bacterium MAG52_C11]|nr:IS110 family transposase [Candidatus Gaiellasilicea maunaloa]
MQVRIARELLGRCSSLTRTILELERELVQQTSATAPALLALPGCGALSAAKLLGEIGPTERFQTDAQLACHAGVAPLEASSGTRQRHRLDRGGNRQLNCALHRIAITQARMHPPPRAYLARKQAEGKSRREAPPLPQTTARPHRLHNTQERAALDIGATLAQATDPAKSAARPHGTGGTVFVSYSRNTSPASCGDGPGDARRDALALRRILAAAAD